MERKQVRTRAKLCGDYGVAEPGTLLTLWEDEARSLVMRGLAEYHVAIPIYETKIVTPSTAQVQPQRKGRR
jgi:hypothetical protein